MTKIVINKCWGGFGLSDEAKKMIGADDAWSIARDDPRLIQAVITLGDRVNDELSKLEIVEIPDDIDWVIDEYDGMEIVEEAHRSWG